MQVLVTADQNRDLRVGLGIGTAGRDARGDAVIPNRRVVEEVLRRGAVVRAGIADRLVEPRGRAEQLADRRSAEALRIGAAERRSLIGFQLIDAFFVVCENFPPESVSYFE